MPGSVRNMQNRPGSVWRYMESTKSCAGPIDTKLPGTFYLNAEQVRARRGLSRSILWFMKTMIIMSHGPVVTERDSQQQGLRPDKVHAPRHIAYGV